MSLQCFFEQQIKYSLDEEGQAPLGTKVSKKRVTALTGASITGKKLPILIVGKAKNPHSFRKHSFRCFKYASQKNAGVTSIIFNKYLEGLDEQMRAEGRHIAITFDNCTAHYILQEDFTNITFFSLPANTTAVMQPMDAGIINSIKTRYRYKLSLRKFKDAYAKVKICLTPYEANVLISKIWNETSCLLSISFSFMD
ncbi:MAG: hypothetical protein EZS28_004136 [Streblomastix strix]|uniref:DDE-1 domain-containing protein n=1 Tax=Streblomastix strix TaxID=222440 RepID=A0A5J4WZB5_9EUKA|nr:MAG: hypothetical protein EZS28_004136 [Streblomastix strix]